MTQRRQLYFDDETTRTLVEKLGKRINEIAGYIYRERNSLSPFRMKQGDIPGGESLDLDDRAWKEFHVPGPWGAYLANFWFRTRFRIPERFADEQVCLHLVPSRRGDLRGAEGLVYLDGKVRQGLQSDRPEVLLEQKAEPGREHLLAIEVYSGLGDEPHVFEVAELAVIDEATSDFYYSAFVALEAAKSLDPGSIERSRILVSLDSAVRMVDFRQPGSQDFYRSVGRAGAFLREQLYQGYVAGDAPLVTCVGHAHLDVVWLWTLAQTRRKAARTFSTSLRSMEQYPEFHFLATQAQLYDFVKRDYPALYEEVRKRVAEGRWEAAGGMWVEPDCNLPSGESLVRQFLFGKRFFREELGVASTLMWFPDSFGYSASLPQIAAKSGMKYFMTTKISWNDTNRFPYDTFWWQGIDGTRLLAHFITTPTLGRMQTYNGNLTPPFLKGCWDEYRQKDVSQEVLMAFGWGDGGGGPTKEMLEAGKRLQNFPGMPRCRMGTAEGFFERLATRATKLPVWNGELYLEYHRGTLTSQGWIKRANRKNEILYHDAEMLATLAMLAGESYPVAELREGWERLLRNQFHDVLPGSAIPEAYQEAKAELEEARTIGQSVLDDALEALGRRIDTKVVSDRAAASGKSVIVWNTLSWTRTDIAAMEFEKGEAPVIVDEDGRRVPQQVVEGSSGGKQLLFLARDIPGLGYRAFGLARDDGRATPYPEEAEAKLVAAATRMENRFFDIALDEKAEIASLFDKRCKRHVLAPGAKGNRLVAFEDKPLKNSAWDIAAFFEEKPWELDPPENVEVIEQGPLRAGILVLRKFLDSTITQKIYIYSHIPRMDFDTEIDWKQTEMLLKAAFPVDVLSGRATYEIQFGNVERPTHRNTSWESAMFEVCAHKWADLSEAGYGVSLLNDCKYGHDIKDNVIRITLLRSPISPDPRSDRGRHFMVYSLYPHEGDWREGGTAAQAYQLNYPLVARTENAHEGSWPARYSFLSLSEPNVIVETVKRAEEGQECVLRLYECFGRRGEVTLEFAEPIVSASESDLVEREGRPLYPAENRIALYVKPYEIRTLVLKFAPR